MCGSLELVGGGISMFVLKQGMSFCDKFNHFVLMVEGLLEKAVILYLSGKIRNIVDWQYGRTIDKSANKKM